MPDVLQDFPIAAPPERVFEAISRPKLIDEWWTLTSSGEPTVGAVYKLGFGPDYQWTAQVTKADPGAAFELTMTGADSDWIGTRVGFQLSPSERGTQVKFYHTGWPVENEHFRISCHCWAMSLRVLRRHIEHGESVPYHDRLDV
jgi:uncharacterized protein YndB with AHSA1/START domain